MGVSIPSGGIFVFLQDHWLLIAVLVGAVSIPSGGIFVFLLRRLARWKSRRNVSIPSGGIFVFLQPSIRARITQPSRFQSRLAGFLFFYVLAAIAAGYENPVSIPSGGIFVFLRCGTDLRYDQLSFCFNPVWRDFCFSTVTAGAFPPNFFMTFQSRLAGFLFFYTKHTTDIRRLG